MPIRVRRPTSQQRSSRQAATCLLLLAEQQQRRAQPVMRLAIRRREYHSAARILECEVGLREPRVRKRPVRQQRRERRRERHSIRPG
jgi:hypothetical protein